MNQKFCNIIVRAILRHVYQVTEAIKSIERTRRGKFWK